MAVGDRVNESTAPLLVNYVQVALELGIDFKEGQVAFYPSLDQVRFRVGLHKLLKRGVLGMLPVLGLCM